MSKKVSKELFRSIISRLKKKLDSAPKTEKNVKIMAMLGRFKAKTDSVRRIHDHGGFFKLAEKPDFTTAQEQDEIDRMRVEWLRDVAGRKPKSPRSGS